MHSEGDRLLVATAKLAQAARSALGPPCGVTILYRAPYRHPVISKSILCASLSLEASIISKETKFRLLVVVKDHARLVLVALHQRAMLPVRDTVTTSAGCGSK